MTTLMQFLTWLFDLRSQASPENVEHRHTGHASIPRFTDGKVVMSGIEAKQLCIRRRNSESEQELAEAIRPQMDVMRRMGYVLNELIVVDFNGEYQVIPSPCRSKAA